MRIVIIAKSFLVVHNTVYVAREDFIDKLKTMMRQSSYKGVYHWYILKIYKVSDSAREGLLMGVGTNTSAKVYQKLG